MSDAVKQDDYFRTIEEEFNMRRGAPLLLSPRDWSLIDSWREAGIPLRVVLRGIANVYEAFERRGPTPRRINSLSYCRQEVLNLHEIDRGLRAAAAGRPAATSTGGINPEQAMRRHLNRLARRVREAMACASETHLDPLVTVLAEVASELKRIRKESKSGSLDPQRFEDELRQLDERMLEAGRRATPSDLMQQLEEQSNAALSDRRHDMSPDAFDATRRADLGRRLRRHLILPRLTLFD